MSVIGGPNVIEDGLVLALDSANHKSYSGTGTEWKDLSGIENDSTLINGPTFTSDNGGSLVFGGASGQRGIIDDAPSLDGFNSMTISTWIRPYGSFPDSNARIILKRGSSTSHDGNGYNMGLESLNNGVFCTNDRNVNVPVNLIANEYHNIVWVINAGMSQWYVYKNGIEIWNKSTNSTPAPINSDICIGNHLSSNRRFVGDISLIFIYNRALTPEEVLQNYNATKGRYGL